MNYSILSDAEIIKYADPATELEKALFSLLKDGLESAKDAEQEADHANQALAECERDLDDAQSDLENAKDTAKKVIELIGEQALFNKDEVIELLQSIG